MHTVRGSGPPPLGITVAHHGSSTVATVTGEIDLATAEQLRSALIAAIDAQPAPSLVIDLAGVSVLDAAGMTALIQVRQHARGRDRTVALINPQPLVGRALEIVDLTLFLGVTRR